MINKIIHYVWLGKKVMPKSYVISNESVIKYANDFEIKVWTEEKLNEFNLPVYFYKLMQEKRYALASDIYRMHILNKFGGIYMDIDQVLVASIDDLLDNEMFISRYHEVNDYYGFGILGVVSGHEFLKNMICFYKNIQEDKYVIVNKIGSEIINDMILFKNKTENKEAEINKLNKTNKLNEINKIKILNQEYFYPLTKYDYTKNTRSYHLANTSWIPFYKKVLHKVPYYKQIKKIIIKVLPNNIKKKIFKIDYL